MQAETDGMQAESETKKKRKKKRSSGTPGSGSPPKKKRLLSLGDGGSKNALQTLNELMPGLRYNCVGQTGPVHQPTFTVHVQINDQVIIIISLSLSRSLSL